MARHSKQTAVDGLRPEAFHLGQPRERSINALQQIYTIVVGIGLTDAVRRLIEPQLLPESAGWLSDSALQALVLFGTLVVTLVPFYHGAVRHLDETYLFHSSAERPKRYAILIEFLLLFVEGVQFVALGEFIRTPNQFYFVFVLLLITDVVWAALSLLAAEKRTTAVIRWAATNAVAGAVFYWLCRTPMVADDQRPYLFFWLAMLRTTFDYALNIDFYLGRRSATAAGTGATP